jgi:hypothetical protein
MFKPLFLAKLWRCHGATGPIYCGHLNYGWERKCWMCGAQRPLIDGRQADKNSTQSGEVS